MFTGIVEEIGAVQRAGSHGLTIGAKKALKRLRPGDSIAVNGACLTAVSVGQDSFAVELSPETLRRTNLGTLKPGDEVNLERALAAGSPMGGHVVQGHVDGTGTISQWIPEGDFYRMGIQAPPAVMRYVVEKGFIAVDGISLTVTEWDATSFHVSVIPYTFKETALRSKREGAVVNLEVDVLAKYVEKLLQRHPRRGKG